MKKSESKTFDLTRPLTPDFLSSNGFLLARQLYIDNVTTLTLHPDKAGDKEFGLMYHYDINSYSVTVVKNFSGITSDLIPEDFATLRGSSSVMAPRSSSEE